MRQIKRLVDRLYMENGGEHTHHHLLEKDRDVQLALIQYSAKTGNSIDETRRTIHQQLNPLPYIATDSILQSPAMVFVEWYISEHKIDCLGHKGLNRYLMLSDTIKAEIDNIIGGMPL